MKNFKLWVQQKSPEILIGVGILNAAASVVLACFATKKATKILSPVKMNMVKIHKKMDILEDDNPKKEEFKIQLRKMYFKAGRKIALVYTPTVISFVLSVISIVSSHKILKGRNLALAAAFTTLKTGYDAYRARVRDKVGEDIEQEIFEGNLTEKIIEKDENGKKKTTTIIKSNADRDRTSDFSVCWGLGQKGFDSRAGGLNLTSLLQAEEWFNQKLRATGYVFLNEIYEHLGFTPGYLGPRRLQASHVLGWIYCPEDTTRDNYISFGIHDKDGKLNYGANNLQQGLADFIWLTFNVDGDILTEDNGCKGFMKIAMRKDS